MCLVTIIVPSSYILDDHIGHVNQVSPQSVDSVFPDSSRINPRILSGQCLNSTISTGLPDIGRLSWAHVTRYLRTTFYIAEVCMPRRVPFVMCDKLQICLFLQPNVPFLYPWLICREKRKLWITLIICVLYSPSPDLMNAVMHKQVHALIVIIKL